MTVRRIIVLAVPGLCLGGRGDGAALPNAPPVSPKKLPAFRPVSVPGRLIAAVTLPC